MSNTNYYSTLGIPKNASQDEVKKAYRKLAHQHHPDKQGGSEEQFKKINEAYQVLSDPKKREQYDRFGQTFPGKHGGFDGFDFSQGFPFGGAQGEGGFGPFGEGPFDNARGGFDFEDIFDIFGEAFGGAFGGPARGPRRAQEQTARGRDAQTELRISFYDMARGGIKEIKVTKENICEECGGTGAKKGAGMVDCTVCQGKGEVTETISSFLGNVTRIYTCRACAGHGKVPKENCQSCKGEGRKRGAKTLEIKIPAGVKNGDTLVVKGEGQPGFRGAQPGDLYIKIAVESDKRFKRNGNDIVYEMPIRLTDVILGARVSVPTLDGEREIEVPAGTQHGDELRLRGFGINGQHKGDQVVKIRIEIPKKLSNKAKRLAEELSREI